MALRNKYKVHENNTQIKNDYKRGLTSIYTTVCDSILTENSSIRRTTTMINLCTCESITQIGQKAFTLFITQLNTQSKILSQHGTITTHSRNLFFHKMFDKISTNGRYCGQTYRQIDIISPRYTKLVHRCPNTSRITETCMS